MGHHGHGRVEADERLLEPLERLDVEVVRGLVEEQQVGLGGERAGQRAARELSPGEGRQRPVEVLVGEAQTVQHRPGALAPAVAAHSLEARRDVAVAGQRLLQTNGFAVGALHRHRVLQPG